MHPPLPTRRTVLALGLACLLTGCAHPGTSTLDAFAALRGRQAQRDVPYGPLERQRLDIYRPDDAAGGAPPPPLVLFFYGGSWSSGDRAQYRFVGEALAAQGFVTLVADYRLYPEVRYPDFLADCARAGAWALEHAAALGADPRRVFLAGHSAGAYNVAMLALDPRWLGAQGHAPAEFAGWIGLAGPYDFLPIGDPQTQLVFDWPHTAPESQPSNHVADLARPLPAFLGAAEGDKLVDPERNTQALAAALRARGAVVEEKLYPHVDHATLLGAFTFPLVPLAPVLADVAAFVRRTPAAAGG